jgi:hypothetical protein
VFPSCFVPITVAIIVGVVVTVVVTVTVTSCQLCQFCGVLSCSSDAPILRQFYGVVQLSTLARV